MRRICLLQGGPLNGLQWDWNEAHRIPSRLRAVARSKSYDDSDRVPFDPTYDPNIIYEKEGDINYYSWSGTEEVHVFHYVGGQDEESGRDSGADIDVGGRNYWLRVESSRNG